MLGIYVCVCTSKPNMANQIEKKMETGISQGFIGIKQGPGIVCPKNSCAF